MVPTTLYELVCDQIEMTLVLTRAEWSTLLLFEIACGENEVILCLGDLTAALREYLRHENAKLYLELYDGEAVKEKKYSVNFVRQQSPFCRALLLDISFPHAH